MHDDHSYSDNLSLASVHYSHAMRTMACTADQGLGYCDNELEPDKASDPLTRLLLFTAIIRVGIRLGISPLTAEDPFAVDYVAWLTECYKDLSKNSLLLLGVRQNEIEQLMLDIALVSKFAGIIEAPDHVS